MKRFSRYYCNIEERNNVLDQSYITVYILIASQQRYIEPILFLIGPIILWNYEYTRCSIERNKTLNKDK